MSSGGVATTHQARGRLRPATALQAVLTILLLAALSLQFGIWTQTEVLKGPFQHRVGYSYWQPFVADIRLPFLFHTPTSGAGGRVSRLQVFENGKRLERNDVGVVIEQQGHGLFSHWGPQISIAASDNSNLNTNGYRYTVEYPILVRDYVLFLLVALLLAITLWRRLRLDQRPFPGIRAIFQRLATADLAMSNTAFWIVFGLILGAALALRVFLTWFFEVPFITPDSFSYLRPVIRDPWFPIDMSRTMGFPLVTSLSMAIFQHPVGMLIGFNILSIGSAVALTLAIRWRLKLNVVALLMLAVMLFTPKDVSFEYFHMSEHVSRCLYILFAAMVLYFDRWRTSLWYIITLALIVVLNVLAKVSAIVLIPVVFVLYAYFWLVEREERWRLARSMALFLVLVVGSVLGYAAAYKQKFGVFTVSQSNGTHFLAHVGHFIDLDGGAYPDLKKELRPIIELYRKKYASVGDHRPNWIVYGSFDADMRPVFGDQSPAGIIAAYVSRQQSNKKRETQNEIYSALAWEGIRAHPLEYLKFAADRFLHLFRDGNRFVYYEYFPLARHIDRHRDELQQLRQFLYATIGEKMPATCPAPVPDSAPWFFRVSMKGLLNPCSSPVYEDAAQRALAEKVTDLYVGITTPSALVYLRLPFVAVIAFLVVVALAPWWRNAAATGYALIVALTVFLLGVFLGLINVAEAGRFMATMQDLVMLSALIIIAVAVAQLRRATLAGVLKLWKEQPPTQTAAR